MSTTREIHDNLTEQLYELEALQAVYPKELIVTDYGVLADINQFICCPTEKLPQQLEYSIEISVDGEIIELLNSLPTNYPKEKPDVYARSSSLNRTQQLLLNEALRDVVERQEEGEPCIYMLISWIQDNVQNYLTASKASQEKGRKVTEKNKEKGETVVFARYWIYSHHIYSKLKRRDIATLAKENAMSGFCLPGKPGIICLEGSLEDCEYCWQKIKTMNWHRIFVRLVEKEENCRDFKSMCKFRNFLEVSFPSTERHNDMGQVQKYLTEHDSQHVFKELFGMKDKSTELLD